ncbi:ArnT family glycosyltransferase [Cryptosporangium sp. NPDC051539]|uniref:ArnT family glycosyltransferase n=1 Tax=Cryptosporangium sp. NPDC051539 TaxID=3363962 RepID=UPI00379765F4
MTSLRTALTLRGWLLLGALCALAVTLALATNPQYGPDSRIYLAWTYWYLGHSPADAAQLSYDYLHNDPGLHNCWTCWRPDFRTSFFTGQYAIVVGPRLLLPVLSAPFVWLLGPSGLLVVPLVGYALAVLATVVLASRLWGQRWALVAGALLLLPIYVSRWSVVGQTEGPAFALVAVPLLFLPLARRTTRKHVVWYVVLVVVGLLNRQFAVALPAAVGATWLLVAIRDRALRNPWLPFAFWGNAVALVVLAAQMLVTPLLFGGDDLALSARFGDLAEDMFGARGVTAVADVTRFVIVSDLDRVKYDLPLTMLLVGATISVVLRYRSELSALAAGAFLTVSAINIYEFWPAGFRYHAPIVPILVLAVVAMLAEWWRPGRVGVRWVAGLPAHAWATIGVVTVTCLAVFASRSSFYGRTSLFHLAWSYRFLGLSPAEATARTYDQLSSQPFFAGGCTEGACWQADLFQHAASADPNLVYPLLSALFVAMFGAPGLLVVPVLAFLVTIVLLARFAAQRWGALAGTATAVAFVICDRIAVSALAGSADMLTIALCCGCLFTLPLDGRRGRLAGFGVLVGLMLASRAPAVAIVGAVGVAWLFAWRSDRSWRNPWLPYLLVSAGLSAAVVALGRVVPFLDARYSGHPRFGSVLAADLTALAGDSVLCAVLVLAIVTTPWRAAKHSLAALALGGIVAAILFEVTTGVPAGARQFGPVFPLILLAVMGMLAGLFERLGPWEAPPPPQDDETDVEPAEPAESPKRVMRT